MKKKLSSIIVLILLIGIFATTVSATSKSVTVIIDGQKQVYDQPAIVENGRTLVPMRGVFESLGATIQWDQKTKTVTGIKDDTTVKLKLGDKNAVVNGKLSPLDVPAKTKNGRTMVPLRFVSEALGAKVTWDSTNFAVNIVAPTSFDYWDDLNQKNPLTVEEITNINDEKVVLIYTNQSQGSGFFIKSNLILTNYHVIEGANSAEIVTSNGITYEIEGIVVFDESLDLAVIKTRQDTNIEPVILGSTVDIKKGQKVIAIGSPIGLQNTVSNGIISGIRKENGVSIIQHTVPITHGSSGGALFNENGEVIGITSSGIKEANANLNFAIPIDYIQEWLKNDLNKSPIFASFPSFNKEIVEPSPNNYSNLASLQSFLEENVLGIPTDVGSLNLNGWTVKQENDHISIFAFMDANQRGLYLDQFYNIEPNINEWATIMGEFLDSAFPQDDVYLGIYYQDIYSFYPSVYDDIEIKSIGNGEWLVTHNIIEISLTDKIRWNIHP